MSTQLTIPAGFGALPERLRNQKVENELGAGIRSGYGVVTYKGKVWAIRHKGQEHTLTQTLPSGETIATPSIEVVIVKSSAFIAKSWYENGYEEGRNAPPDCGSSNGITPDAGVPKPQNATCASCPKNQWGSRITPQGKKGKACADKKRIALVPAQDLTNEAFGGAMLLGIPAGSLTAAEAYAKALKDQLNCNPHDVVTRISFDMKEPFPKFVFSPVRPLTDAEFAIVKAIREDEATGRILQEGDALPPLAKPQQEPPKLQFEQVAPPPAPKPAPAAIAPPLAPTAPVEVRAVAPGLNGGGPAASSLESELDAQMADLLKF